MATLERIIGQTSANAITLSNINYINPQKTFGGNTLFICDAPETINNVNQLTDGNSYLLKENVTGKCTIYCWHHNGLPYAIQHAIKIYNPNTYSITIQKARFNTLYSNKNYTVSDNTKWESYLLNNGNSNGNDITIAPKKSSVIITGELRGEIKNSSGTVTQHGGQVGILGDIIIIKQGTSTYAPAVMAEFCYKDAANINNTLNLAPSSRPLFRRGLADSSNLTINCGYQNLTDNKPIAFKMFPDGLNRDDLYITCSTGQGSGNNDGGYGLELIVNMSVVNKSSSTKDVYFFMGTQVSPSAFSFPIMCAKTYESSSLQNRVVSATYIPGAKCLDLMKLKGLKKDEAYAVQIKTAVPAVSTTPLYFGARLV